MSPYYALECLVNMFPHPAALVDQVGMVVYRNEKFGARFGEAENIPWLNLVGDTGLLREAEKRALSLGRQAGAEAPLPNKDGKLSPVWCDIYPLNCDAGALHVVVLHSTQYLRDVELMYMHRIRKNTDDNLWLLDDAGRVIWFRVGTSNPHGQEDLGRQALELVEEKDHALALRSAQEARRSPGKIVHMIIHLAKADMAAEVYMAYLPAGLYGNRFYAAARRAVPRGNRIVDRMMEAYQVETYTALADKMHINKSSITRAAHTDSAPAELLVRCHDDTGVSLDWLLTGQGSKELW